MNQIISEKSIWESLKSKGTPPEKGTLLFTGGLMPVLNKLCEYYLKDIAQVGSFDKLVVGQYGGGKTHFLRAFQELANQEGFVTSFVALSNIDDYHDYTALLMNILQNIRLPSDSLDSDNERPPFALLKGAIKKKKLLFEERGMTDPEAGLEAWCDQLRFQNFPHPEYGKVLYKVIKANLDNDSDLVEIGLEWLQGIKLPANRKKALNVAAISGKANLNRHGLQLILSLFELIKESGFKGTCLLLDEAENAFNVKGKAKAMALGTLRNLGDKLSGRPMQSTCMLTAVTREVEDSFVDYMALQQRYARIGGPFSLENPSSPVIDLSRLPDTNLSILKDIGEKLIDLANRIYPNILDYEIEKQNIYFLAEHAESHDFDVNHRRLFVKTATWMIDNNIIHKGQSKLWIEDDIISLYKGQYEAVIANDQSDDLNISD